jgi:hypothetical protein
MKTLWFATERKRQFLIPDSHPPTNGDLELHTSLGRRRRVSEEDVLRFEVSREEAAEWSKERLKEMLGGKKADQTTGDEASAADAPLPLFSALSGESAEDLHADPEALKRGLREVGAKLGAVLKEATSVSAEERERAKVRLEELRAAVAEAESAKAAAEPGGDGEGNTARAETQRQGAEKALRSFAGLVGSLGRAAERAGTKLTAAADELREQREAAQTAAEAEGGAEEGAEKGEED